MIVLSSSVDPTLVQVQEMQHACAASSRRKGETGALSGGPPNIHFGLLSLRTIRRINCLAGVPAT